MSQTLAAPAASAAAACSAASSPARRQRSSLGACAEGAAAAAEGRLSTDCVVCLEPVAAAAARALCCGHAAWHADCVAQWLSHRPRCPLCAAPDAPPDAMPGADAGAAPSDIIAPDAAGALEPEWALDERRVHTIVRGRRASSVSARPRRRGRRSPAARFRRGARGYRGGVVFLRFVKCVL